MTYQKDFIKKRILITGANGMLGQRTTAFFSSNKNIELLPTSIEENPFTNQAEYKQCDITDRTDFKKLIYDFCPDFIINTAAFTNVDLSESERETAWRTNVKAVEYISEVARVIDAHVIHVSTDYIFDGKNGPYTENTKPNPVGYYGRTKLASENVLKLSGTIFTVLRTNVLYGIAENSRPDFVRWVVDSLSNNKKINIVTDQINNPTFLDDLVQAISKIIEFRKAGIFNIGGKEFLSRFGFTQRIAEYFNLDKNLITPILTEDLNQPARRPLNSGLIILKAESELGYKPHTLEESFSLMKKNLIT
jgi:dTDP-4-dehydrorhamnose reductase